jgi:hypothetical protein
VQSRSIQAADSTWPSRHNLSTTPNLVLPLNVLNLRYMEMPQEDVAGRLILHYASKGLKRRGIYPYRPHNSRNRNSLTLLLSLPLHYLCLSLRKSEMQLSFPDARVIKPSTQGLQATFKSLVNESAAVMHVHLARDMKHAPRRTDVSPHQTEGWQHYVLHARGQKRNQRNINKYRQFQGGRTSYI